MYRDDLTAAHARLEQLQRDLAEASSQGVQDRQRIADLTAQLNATRDALTRMGAPSQFGAPYGAIQYPSRAGTVLVLGILSIVVCTVLGPIAWSMGNEELRRIDLGQVDPMSRNAASAGRICGIVATVFMILGVVLFIGIFALAAGTRSHY